MPLSARQVRPKEIRRAHLRVAAFLLIFIAVHFATHFASLGGFEFHTLALGYARVLYQFPLVEIALVAALAMQVVLGIKLLTQIRKRKSKDRWHWAQFVSGCYLAYFIILHTAAALITRLGVGLDTNFYWAAGTLALAPIKYYFAPYYTLAVIAVATHVIAALHFRGPRRWHAAALIAGPVMGVCFVLGYGGAFERIEVPQKYIDYYAFLPGVEA